MLINGAILATVLTTEFGSGSKVSREKELSVFVSREEIEKEPSSEIQLLILRSASI